MLKHLITHSTSILITQFTLTLSTAIILESGLSFLGLSTPLPITSLGGILTSSPPRRAGFPAPYRQIISSPYLFGATSVIWGGRTPPGFILIPSVFRALFLMFSFPKTSLYASKPQLGHFNLLYPLSSSFESHCGHSEDVSLGSTVASGAPCLADCQSIHLSSLEYPIMISFVLWFLGSFLSASISP